MDPKLLVWMLVASAVVAVHAGGCRISGPSAALGRPFRVIAHRGASGYAPENTLPAFERALELGAFEVELDVQLSRDGVLVLFHDRILDDKTDASGTVRDHDAEELRQVEIGIWFDREHHASGRRYAGTKLATLRELFAHFGDRLYDHIEIKALEESIPALVLDLVREFRLEKRVTITSFDWEQLARTRALDARIPVCLLLRDEDVLLEEAASSADLSGADLLTLQRHWVDRAGRARFDQVAIAARDLSAEVVAYAHAQGLELRAWGVRSRADMLKARRLGTNGMTINWPDRLLQLLADERT